MAAGHSEYHSFILSATVTPAGLAGSLITGVTELHVPDGKLTGPAAGGRAA